MDVYGGEFDDYVFLILVVRKQRMTSSMDCC